MRSGKVLQCGCVNVIVMLRAVFSAPAQEM